MSCPKGTTWAATIVYRGSRVTARDDPHYRLASARACSPGVQKAPGIPWQRMRQGGPPLPLYRDCAWPGSELGKGMNENKNSRCHDRCSREIRNDAPQFREARVTCSGPGGVPAADGRLSLVRMSWKQYGPRSALSAVIIPCEEYIRRLALCFLASRRDPWLVKVPHQSVPFPRSTSKVPKPQRCPSPS